MGKINPREIVLKMLYKVSKEESYSNIVLDQELKKYKLENRDSNFVTQIFYGVITYKMTIDYIISKYSKIKLSKISDYILNILRMGIYQIIYLDKIPKHAIVNESVNLAKKYSNKGASGFVNALLKNIEKDELDNLSFTDELVKISILTSHPKWLVDVLVKEYGIDNTKKICKFNNIEAPICIRVNTLKISQDELIKRLEDSNIKCENTEVESSLIVKGLSNISNNKLFKEGYFTIQDTAATLVGNIAHPFEGNNVLDMCSSPGGKTTHMAELMNNKGKIIACDIYENRVKLVEENAKRLGIDIIHTVKNDGTVLKNDYINKFDVVLVDAPCSGIGVIRRKIDIKYQRKENDINEIKKIQKLILENASQYVKKDGYVIYSTCTILKEENEEVIKQFITKYSNFEVVNISNYINNNQSKDKYIKTLPHINGIDGFFIAKMKRIN